VAAEIGIAMPNNQRLHRTVHAQKDVLPCALCKLLCPVSTALTSIFFIDSISSPNATEGIGTAFWCD